nr:MAG TPA: hypothetical protein [Caudoviricetes sp.]
MWRTAERYTRQSIKSLAVGESLGLQYGSNPYPPTTGWQ